MMYSMRAALSAELIPALFVLSAAVCSAPLAAGQGGALPKEQREPAAVTELKPAWLESREGITDKVLAPWTPIEVARSGDRLQIGTWGRSYVFDGCAFPTQIKSKEAEILAGAVSLRAKVDGEETVWPASAIRMEETEPGRISWSQNIASQNGKMTLSVKTAIEYDGLMRTDLKLEPRGKIRLEELTFEIPLKSECAELIYCFPDLIHRRFRNCGALPNDGVKTEFTPFVWLGNEDRGLQWFCESDENWHNADPNQAIEVKKDGDKTVIRLRLVSVPTQMSLDGQGARRGLSYTFGLMATPVRPIVKDPWDYKMTTPPYYGRDYWLLDPAHMMDGKLQLDYLAGLGLKTIQLWNWNDFFSPYTSPLSHSHDFRDLVKACHMRGIQVLPYFCHLLSERAPEWGAFGPKMRVIPEDRLESHFKWEPQEAGDKVCCRSLFQDYLVDGIARLMDEYDVDGVYLDGIPCPWPCKNPLHGCGYTRPDGSVHVTYPIFAVRETVRRIYTVVKSRKPDGEVCIHTSSAMPAPVMAWSTSQLTGEQFGQGAYDFPEDDASLPIFRTMCMAPQWGVPAEFVPWTLGWSYRKASAFTLLHDVLAEPDTGDLELESKLWRLSDEFGRKNAEWLPYWRNAEYVKVTPKGAYASLYKYPRNGVLAVVSNLSRANATVHVQLDFEKLELRKDATIKDSLTGEPLALQNGEVELNLAPLGWKIVWLK